MFTTHDCFLDLPENLRISMTSDHSVQSYDTCRRNIKPTYVERFGLSSLEEEASSITLIDQSSNKLASVILTPLESKNSSVHMYPELFQDIVTYNKKMLELSNIEIFKINKNFLNRQIFEEILSYVNKYCIINGYDEIYFLYDNRISPIFTKIDWMPEVVSKTQNPNGVFSLGRWQVSYMRK